jgi:methylated-DNA-[protein]-cysteine S-methyltransferase
MTGPTATVRIASPIGMISLTATDDWLTGIHIARSGGAREESTHIATGHPVLAQAQAQMRGWFAGERHSFDLPLAPLETAEGQALRAAIAAIPYGKTITYGALATQCGSVARAVGQACKTNAFPIIIPCHRVISTSGPEFYSGGDGPRTKSWLIDFEYANLPAEQRTRLI